ncbi:histidinol-phosphate aminotransferase [Nocardioides terrae]|uniref:Aromatic amino acid aminotransferase n=2 Tax=Nocardioides terrae TaxID=574651 RepID=A0A1I1EX89_9ACTN|nr:histidinol-phosphate aminotransferase [Nocardioides terrae]
MPPYVAGKPASADAFKLSSNENPYPPLPGVLEAAVTAAASMNRYPDMGNAALYAALAEAYDVPATDLAVATGSTGLIYGLLSAFCEPGDEVLYAWRSFEAYPIAVLAAGATSVQVPLLADGRHDLDAMAAAVGERTKVVLLCSPNNPTGPALTQAEVDGFLDRVPDDVLVVLDEAYIEFVRIDGPVDGVATYRGHSNVTILRTFSKAYGLAGFRVGYCIAPQPVAAALRAVTLPFGVNLVAQAAAVASLAARAELLERVDALVGERTRVLAGVRAAGWEVPDAQGNFVWFGFPDQPERIAAFVAAAEGLGIMVRPLGTDGVRVTIGEDEANDRLIRLAETFER